MVDPKQCPDHCPEGLGVEACSAFNDDLPEPLRILFQRLCCVNRNTEASIGLRKLCAGYRHDVRGILEHLERHPEEKLTADEWQELHAIFEDMGEDYLAGLCEEDKSTVEGFFQSLEHFRPAGV